MSVGALVAEGHCRCGQLRFRVTGPPMFTAACHCRGCQRMAGSAFSLSTCYPRDAFEVLEGEPVLGGMHGDIHHYHCAHCLSWVYTRPDPIPQIVNVRTSMLEPIRTEPPYLEVFTSAALPWAKTGATFSFPEFPPMERYLEIIEQYRRDRLPGFDRHEQDD